MASREEGQTVSASAGRVKRHEGAMIPGVRENLDAYAEAPICCDCQLPKLDVKMECTDQDSDILFWRIPWRTHQRLPSSDGTMGVGQWWWSTIVLARR